MKKQKHPMLTVTATLLVTLLLGMILGGVIVGGVIRDRVETLREIRTAAGFVRHVSERIGPVPADSQARFQAIVNGTGQKVEHLLGQGRSDLMQIIDDMERELVSVVTAEQLERWQADRRKVREQIDGN